MMTSIYFLLLSCFSPLWTSFLACACSSFTTKLQVSLVDVYQMALENLPILTKF